MSTLAQSAAKPWNHGLRRQVLVESLLREIVNGQIRSGEHLVTQALPGGSASAIRRSARRS